MAITIGRREFIGLLGGTTAAWPLAAQAQQSTAPVIGYLSSGSPEVSGERLRMFLQGLSDAGYNDGKKIAIEYRWADGKYDRLPELAADLVRRQVRVIVVPDSVVTARAAKSATTTIPVVFGIGADPVDSGLVASLNRPGGNLTGATRLNVQLEPKRLELLHELVPTASTIALLVNPANPNAQYSSKEMTAGTRLLGLALHVLEASTDRDLDLAFGQLAPLGAGGLVISPDPFFLARSARLAELALAHRIPAIFEYREFAAAGGLASYAGSPTESDHRLGSAWLYRPHPDRSEAGRPSVPAKRHARAEHQSQDS